MKSSQSCGPESGTTLIEVMVALAIFALVSAAAISLMVWTVDQQSAVRARMDRLGQIQRAHALLRSDLSQAALRRVRQENGQPGRDAFLGAPPGRREGLLFAFVRRGWDNPDQAPRASLQYVEYQLVDGRLQRLSRTALDGRTIGPAQVLLDEVSSIRVRYHAYRQWSDGWTGGAELLPDAVALDMELRDYGSMRQVFLLPEAGR